MKKKTNPFINVRREANHPVAILFPPHKHSSIGGAYVTEDCGFPFPVRHRWHSCDTGVPQRPEPIQCNYLTGKDLPRSAVRNWAYHIGGDHHCPDGTEKSCEHLGKYVTAFVPLFRTQRSRRRTGRSYLSADRLGSTVADSSGYGWDLSLLQAVLQKRPGRCATASGKRSGSLKRPPQC